MKINREILMTILAIAGWQPQTKAQTTPIDLGSAGSFAVLAGTGITVTGATTITGDIGTYPTTTIAGLANISLTGLNHAGDTVTQSAETALSRAYTTAAGRSATTTYGAIDLGGLTLTPGVYNGSSTIGITGILTLNAQNNPNAVWIFQAESALNTAVNSQVELINGAQSANIFWQVGSSATLGVGSNFSGSILAHTSITLNTGVDLSGRALALTGAVTLDTNTITTPAAAVPEPAETSVLIAGFFGLLIGIRRIRSIIDRRIDS